MWMMSSESVVVGNWYRCRGERVQVIARWLNSGKGTRRNVLIRYEDGRLVVRPFRGLRKEKDDA